MAFGKKGKSSKSKGKSSFKKLGSIWESDEYPGTYYFTQDKANKKYTPAGKLVWQDAETEKLYDVDFASIFENKSENAPENLKFDVCINLEKAKEVDFGEDGE